MGLKSPFGPLALAEIGPFLPRCPPHFSKGKRSDGKGVPKKALCEAKRAARDFPLVSIVSQVRFMTILAHEG